MTCERIHDSGPYVLGALSPAERDAYEAHLATCDECQAEVDVLSPLPALLALVDTQTADAIATGGEEAITRMIGGDPPYNWAGPTAWRSPTGWAGPTAQPGDEPTGGEGPVVVPAAANGSSEHGQGVAFAQVLDLAQARKRSERRRRRWQTAGVSLVAACLAVAVLLGVRAADVGGPAYRPMLAVPGAPTTVSAEVALQPLRDGTQIRMQCRYDGHDNNRWTLRLFVVPKMGDAVEVTNWRAGDGDEFSVTTSTPVKPGDIRRVELRKGDGTTLLAYDT
jgi:Putative zinc-finger